MPADDDHHGGTHNALPEGADASSGPPAQPLLLSIDFEDWHQLVRRRLGIAEWEQAGPALPRQTERLLALLDELQVRATFFVLGMAARAYPELIANVVAHGHEIGCHGDAHVLVHNQTPQQFTDDLRRACATIEQVSGRRPLGYRAPAFSITRETPWAYEALADQSFAYDASQYDSPRIRHRVISAEPGPHPLAPGDGSLWEFPVAVWRTGSLTVPVGGASYWAAMPSTLVLRGLREAGPLAGLYLHPYELDPQRLQIRLSAAASLRHRTDGALRSVQRNLTRMRAPGLLREIAERHPLIPYGEAHAQLSRGTAART